MQLKRFTQTMKIKLSTTLILFLFQRTLVTAQASSNLSAADCLQFINSTFNKLNDYNGLPRDIKRKLNSVVEGRFRITKKDKKFEATDFHVGLIPGIERKESFVGKSENLYLIAYEHGGRGIHNHVLILKKEASGSIIVYNFVTAALIKNSESFQYWLRENQMFRQELDDM